MNRRNKIKEFENVNQEEGGINYSVPEDERNRAFINIFFFVRY